MALIDQYTLSQDTTFKNRVKASCYAAAVAIHNEVYTRLTPERDAFGKKIVTNSPASITDLVAVAVAVDATVASLAGVPPVQANVTDVAINNAVSAAWNSFAVETRN